MDSGWSASEVQKFLYERIPLTKTMGVRVERCDSGTVEIVAPLELNFNHLGTAFGGSLAAVATVAGYVALWTQLGDRGAHVVVRRSGIDYRHPVTKEIRARCELPAERIGDDFKRVFQQKGKARMVLPVVISEGGRDCVIFSGEFVAMR